MERKVMLAIVLFGKADARPDKYNEDYPGFYKGPVFDMQTCRWKPIFNPGIRIIIQGLKIGLPMATLEALSKVFGHLMK